MAPPTTLSPNAYGLNLRIGNGIGGDFEYTHYGHRLQWGGQAAVGNFGSPVPNPRVSESDDANPEHLRFETYAAHDAFVMARGGIHFFKQSGYVTAGAGAAYLWETHYSVYGDQGSNGQVDVTKARAFRPAANLSAGGKIYVAGKKPPFDQFEPALHLGLEAAYVFGAPSDFRHQIDLMFRVGLAWN